MSPPPLCRKLATRRHAASGRAVESLMLLLSGGRKRDALRGKAAETLMLLLSGAKRRVCGECGTVKTPMWRRVEKIIYCNACGIRRRRTRI